MEGWRSLAGNTKCCLFCSHTVTISTKVYVLAHSVIILFYIYWHYQRIHSLSHRLTTSPSFGCCIVTVIIESSVCVKMSSTYIPWSNLTLWTVSQKWMRRWGDSLSFVQFKKRKKHRWRSVTFSKFACFSL